MSLRLSLGLNFPSTGEEAVVPAPDTIGPALTAYNTAIGADSDAASFNANDLSTMWQDTGAATAVTSGDPVRLLQDQSGNGNDLVSPSDAERPTATSGLTFDGTNDQMGRAVPFSTNMVFGVLYRGTDTNGIIAELGASSRFLGCFQDGNGSATFTNAGMPTTERYDSGSDSLTTITNSRNALHDAISDGAWQVIIFSGVSGAGGANRVDFSGYTAGGGFEVTGQLVPIGFHNALAVSDAAAAKSALVDLGVALSQELR